SAALQNVVCGELVLDNPTVMPAGPYCPGDVVDITFTGVNLWEGDSIDVYFDMTSSFNPFAGEGTLIGSIPIEYGCTDCPSLLGVQINACNVDQENEFVLFHSGCGFSVSDLHIDLLPDGPSANDMGAGTMCGFMAPSPAVMSPLQNDLPCSSVNVIAAGDGDVIPPAALVIVLVSNTPQTVDYDFSSLCSAGLPIYIIQYYCLLTTGAFNNNCPGSPYTFEFAGCPPIDLTYTCGSLPTPGGSGHVFLLADGITHTSSLVECNPDLSIVTIPDVIMDPATISFT